MFSTVKTFKTLLKSYLIYLPLLEVRLGIVRYGFQNRAATRMEYSFGVFGGVLILRMQCVDTTDEVC